MVGLAGTLLRLVGFRWPLVRISSPDSIHRVICAKTLTLNSVTSCLYPSSFRPKCPACYPWSWLTLRNNDEAGFGRGEIYETRSEYKDERGWRRRLRCRFVALTSSIHQSSHECCRKLISISSCWIWSDLECVCIDNSTPRYCRNLWDLSNKGWYDWEALPTQSLPSFYLITIDTDYTQTKWSIKKSIK